MNIEADYYFVLLPHILKYQYITQFIYSRDTVFFRYLKIFFLLEKPTDLSLSPWTISKNYL